MEREGKYIHGKNLMMISFFTFVVTIVLFYIFFRPLRGGLLYSIIFFEAVWVILFIVGFLEWSKTKEGSGFFKK